MRFQAQAGIRLTSCIAAPFAPLHVSHVVQEVFRSTEQQYFSTYLPLVIKQMLGDELDEKQADQVIQGDIKLADANVSGFLHERGVNLRHMGVLYNLLVKIAEGHPRFEYVQLVLLQEMIFRALKRAALDRLRRGTREDRLLLFDAPDVLDALLTKFPELRERDRDALTRAVQLVSLNSNAPASRNLLEEVRRAVLNTVSDVVQLPDVVSMERLEEHLLNEVKFRESQEDISPGAVLEVMTDALMLYTNHFANDLGARPRIADFMTRMQATADADELLHSSVYFSCGIFWEQAQCYDQAVPLMERALSLKTRRHDGQHETVAIASNSLAGVLLKLGAVDRCITLYEQALRIREALYGNSHSKIVDSLVSLGDVYARQNQFEVATSAYQRALQICEAHGDDRSLFSFALHNLALLFYKQKRFDEAGPLYERALQVGLETLGEQHPEVLNAMHSLALNFKAQCRYEDAVASLQRCLLVQDRASNSKQADIADTCCQLATVYRLQNDAARAEAMLIRSLEIWKGTPHPDPEQVPAVQKLLQEIRAARSTS